MKINFKYIILMFIISIGIGFLMAKQLNRNETIISKENLESNKIENEMIENGMKENKITNDFDILETSFEDDKIEFDTKLILKKNYVDCKHSISKEVELPGELINLTKEELKKNYPDWNIEEFDDDEVVLSKNIYGLCNEHFIIEAGDEYIEVYSLNEKYDKKLYEITNISTEYLAEEDLQKLMQGIYVYGLQELNSTLENFE